jgi:hypothetical protein
MDAYVAPYTEGGCLLRTTNDIQLAFDMQKGIGIPGGIRSIDNLKVRSGMWSMPARLSLLIVFIMALILTLKTVVKYVGLRAEEIRVELRDLYITEYIRKYIIGITLHIAVFVAVCTVFALWFKAVRFTVTIDVALIPRSLIDVSEWAERLAEYARNCNSAHNIPFSPAYQIGLYGLLKIATLTNAMAIIIILIMCNLKDDKRYCIVSSMIP